MAITVTREQIAERPSRLAEIERGLRVFHEPGEVFEIRVLGIPGRGRPFTSSGYFDDFAKAAKACLEYDYRGAAGVYHTLNPCNPALLARSPNTMTDYPQHTTTDQEIIRRRWLLVDIDPHRPSGIAASDEERATAMELAYTLETKLKDFGYADPIIQESGNGYYLLYRIDLENTQEVTDAIKKWYAGLNAPTVAGGIDPTRPYAMIDTTVYNPARIIRVPGTTNRKGNPTADRPHRRAFLCSCEEVES